MRYGNDFTKIAIIVGSVSQNSQGIKVAHWME